jgi:hypothetical protein
VDTAATRNGQPSPQIADALAEACAEAGMVAAGARLLRMHSNTVFYLPASNAVARVNTGLDGASRVAASLTATQWLALQGFPTVRPKVSRPVVRDGIVVSFWEYEETVKADRSLPALAGLLRDLHANQDAPHGLPAMPSPLLGTAGAVRDHPGAFDGDDRDWLAAEVSACAQRWEAMRFVRPPGLIHGDAHPNNMLYTRRGVLLGEWDHVGCGPREWDLVQAVYFHRRFPAPGDDLDAAAVFTAGTSACGPEQATWWVSGRSAASGRTSGRRLPSRSRERNCLTGSRSFASTTRLRRGIHRHAPDRSALLRDAGWRGRGRAQRGFAADGRMKPTLKALRSLQVPAAHVGEGLRRTRRGPRYSRVSAGTR